MRSQHLETLLGLIIKAHEQDNQQALANYIAKAKILTDRGADDTRTASVIRELSNHVAL